MNDNFDGNTNVIDYEIIGWQETDCWSDAHLINAFVAKITTELSSCKPCL